MTRLATAILSIAVLTASAIAPASWAQGAGFQPDVTFTETSPLSSNPEMARRMLSPLTAAQLPHLLAKSGKALADQPIDPSLERFGVYVPQQEPPSGYGLLVFVPPWPEAKLPTGWAAVLDRYGLIFVTAARSGNEESILGRREPLALIAAANIESRYRVDPKRVYVGGLSGGSRIALRLALAYPDLFRGALLNAGSDPIGGTEMPLPPHDLFSLFQTRSRLVYFTGGQDTDHLAMDGVSLASMQTWCVSDVEDQVIPWGHHEIASADALDRALGALDAPIRPNPDRLAGCRAAIDREIDKRLDQAQALLAAGKRDAAMSALAKIDRRYGGLAAPRSIDLASP